MWNLEGLSSWPKKVYKNQCGGSSGNGCFRETSMFWAYFEILSLYMYFETGFSKG
jgi:hypothetical protein